MAVALIGWLWCNFPSLHLNRRCYSRHHDIQGYLKLFANIEAMWSRISPGILDPFSHKQDPYLGMGSWQFLIVLLPKCSTFQWIRHGQTKTHSVGNHQHHLLNSISHFCADDPQKISHHLPKIQFLFFTWGPIVLFVGTPWFLFELFLGIIWDELQSPVIWGIIS